MKLRIITPEREVLNTEVEHAIFPSVNGQMDILPGHARLMALLQEGEIQYFNNEKIGSLPVFSGCVEVADDKVLVLVNGNL